MTDRAGLHVVVTGGRNYADRATVYRVLDMLKPVRVAQGGATGADELARDWCADRGVECETYRAAWSQGTGKRIDRTAGPKRNTVMLAKEQPDLVVAFPGDDGTADCTKKARSSRILTLQVVP